MSDVFVGASSKAVIAKAARASVKQSFPDLEVEVEAVQIDAVTHVDEWSLTKASLVLMIDGEQFGHSALALKRQLGMSYPIGWLVHYKIMYAMAERGGVHPLTNVVQMDDAYLGGGLTGGMANGIGLNGYRRLGQITEMIWRMDDGPQR